MENKEKLPKLPKTHIAILKAIKVLQDNNIEATESRIWALLPDYIQKKLQD